MDTPQTPDDLTTVTETAYRAFCEVQGGKTWQGLPRLPWGELHETEKAAWRHAIGAAVGHGAGQASPPPIAAPAEARSKGDEEDEDDKSPGERRPGGGRRG